MNGLETGSVPGAAGPVPVPAAPRRPERRYLFEYTQAAVIALIFALFVRTYLFQMFKIPSASMEDTLLIGDHLLVNKFALAPLRRPWETGFLPLADVRRGDIVIFRYPHDPQQDYVKRIIGLPGEGLKIVNNVVYIQEKGAAGFAPIAEPYTVHKHPGEVPPELVDFGPVTVPDGQYFAMGDNRDDSLDSREWGFVPRENIVGRALVIYWSFDGVGPDGALALAPESDQGLARIGHALTSVFRFTRWERSGKVVR
ncbi:MAG TPA: signal peptidase I [Candidatus Polarisedimenticolia bacterium]|nr:signal peptidase I [Candidatus Polarisedimenticolia bacterium]